MLVYRKNMIELEREAVESLSKTRINNVHDGSRALSLVRALNSIIYDFYDELDRTVDYAFLSRAEGGFLDLLGELLNCERDIGESDENYRFRISNQIQVVAGGNRLSIEMQVRNIPEVKKIIFRNFTRGTGSFSAYVITSNLEEVNSAISTVQEILDRSTSFGVKGVAESPRILEVSMLMNIVFSSTTPNASKSSIILDVKRKTKEVIDKIDMGEPLIISSLFQEIRNVHPSIFDVVIQRITVGSKPILVSNYTPYWDEKFFVRSIESIEVL